jgi:hypothetical protein
VRKHTSSFTRANPICAPMRHTRPLIAVFVRNLWKRFGLAERRNARPAAAEMFRQRYSHIQL